MDEFNSLGRELEADLEEHHDGTATVEFSGGEFCSYTIAEQLEAKARELAVHVVAPACLCTDCDGERGEIRLGESGPHERWTIVLADGAQGFHDTVPVQLDWDGACLAIKPVGYGEAEAADGHGAPVRLEFYGGRLRLMVAPDVNTTDKQIIDLEGARESNRT